MRTNHIMLLALVLFLVTASTGGMAARAKFNLRNCATTSTTMELEGPCSSSSGADLCETKFQGSGTCFPQGCKCSFCRDIPPATKN